MKDVSFVGKVVGLAVLAPAFFQGGVTWAWASYWHVLAVCWMSYAFYFLGSRAVQLPGPQRIATAATLGFNAARDFTSDTFHRMD